MKPRCTPRMLYALLLVVSSALLDIAYANAAEKSDHPLLSRFPGSEEIARATEDFGELNYLVASKDKKTAVMTPINGAITKIYYVHNKETSTLAIIKNVENALKAEGFSVVHSAQGEAILNHFDDIRSIAISGHNMVVMYDPRYLYLKRETSSGNQHIAVYATNYSANKFHIYYLITQEKNQTFVPLHVSKADIENAIKSKGKIALYGIYFDSGKSQIKPESSASLKSIADALNENSLLKIRIVGHTDNTGNFDANLKLSEARAIAALNELIKSYKVNKSQISAHGVGSLAPVETNSTEDGKARNRRVELVQQ